MQSHRTHSKPPKTIRRRHRHQLTSPHMPYSNQRQPKSNTTRRTTRRRRPPRNMPPSTPRRHSPNRSPPTQTFRPRRNQTKRARHPSTRVTSRRQRKRPRKRQSRTRTTHRPPHSTEPLVFNKRPRTRPTSFVRQRDPHKASPQKLSRVQPNPSQRPSSHPLLRAQR